MQVGTGLGGHLCGGQMAPRVPGRRSGGGGALPPAAPPRSGRGRPAFPGATATAWPGLETCPVRTRDSGGARGPLGCCAHKKFSPAGSSSVPVTLPPPETAPLSCHLLQEAHSDVPGCPGAPVIRTRPPQGLRALLAPRCAALSRFSPDQPLRPAPWATAGASRCASERGAS